jgi:hypothetical protein
MNLQALAVCRWLGSVPDWFPAIPPGTVTCTAAPWATFLGGIAGLAVALLGLAMAGWPLIARAGRPASQAPAVRPPGVPIIVAGIATLLAGLVLGAVSGAPEFRPIHAAVGQHVILVVDASESATRDLAGWRAGLAQARTALAPIAAEPDATGSLILFGASVRDGATQIPLQRLLDLLTGQRPLDGQEADGTAPKRALQQALQLARASPRPSRLVVISDGLWTEAAPLAEVQQAAALGLRIDVVPLDAGPAKLGIISSHLPLAVDSGARVPTRLVVAGAANETTEVIFSRNRGDTRRQSLEIWPAPRQIRIDETFDGRGIQFVEATLARADGTRQISRLYTTVLAPPRLLVLGAAPWVDRLPRERFEITRHNDARTPVDTSQADVVIVDNLAANELHPDTSAHIAAGVQRSGLGLFFVNGPMRGKPTDDTVVSSYSANPLGGVLPVSPDRDLQRHEPPPRMVAIAIDRSGSMSEGNKFALMKSISRQIIGKMNDRDSIILETFPPSPSAIRTPLPMAGGGRARALAFIDSLSPGGGSSVQDVLDLLDTLPRTNCASFLITDGDVTEKRRFAPGCSFNYIEIKFGGGQYESGDLRDVSLKSGTPVSLSLNATSAGAVEFSYFNPPPEIIKFRDQRFVPEGRVADPAIAPRVAVNGVAITFVRPDANLVLFRDAFPADPVLAFRAPSTTPRHGETGAFLGAITGDWLAAQPIAAIANHLERLSGWQQRDKLQIELREIAGRLQVRIVPLGDKRAPRSLRGLAAVVDLDDGRSIAVDPIARTGDPSSFEGTFDLPSGAQGEAVKGRLRLTHEGRVDRIPITIPALAAAESRVTQESYTSNKNVPALEALATPTLGRVLSPDQRLETARVAPLPPPTPLHPYLLPFAALACFLAFIGRQSKP